MDIEIIRKDGINITGGTIRYEFGEWILRIGGQQLAWARDGASDWIVLAYSGSKEELAEIVADGLSEADAVEELIAVGDIIVGMRDAA